MVALSKETKTVKCVGCGKDIEVSKFMSALKARCQDCKNSGRRSNSSNSSNNISRGPRIDGPPSKALSRLCCPYHPDNRMTVIGVIKSKWGDIVSLQCRVDGCWTLVQISEQQRHMGPLRSKVHGIGFESDDDVSRFVEHMKNGSVDNIGGL